MKRNNMHSGALLLLLVAIVAIVVILSQPTSHAKRKAIGFISITSAITASLFFVLYQPMPEEVVQEEQPQMHSDFMADIQAKLSEDPNQGELWFQLGHGYMLENEFKSALTSFDYSIRLSSQISANQLAAKASALYYLHSQRISPEVEELLQRALDLDSTNTTVLTLIANDHFVSFRYQQAIDTWVRLLDSQQTDLDRVAIISSINQAKSLIANR
ncbi:nitrite reductase [Vibrio kyushuensis]|uniref:TPR domain-containing protein n=1 Tax=Vibrio kyushuensis TaxID=2910249 RepID=UPI003D0B3B9B